MAKLVSRRHVLRAARIMLGVLCAMAPAVAAWAQTQHHHGRTIVEESKHFTTIGYDDKRGPRPVQMRRAPATAGDPAVGKRLAQSDSKGRCLNCHVLDRDGVLAGDVGPNLSTYGTWGMDPAYTFQQVWDARARNPRTIMPPFGTNELLSEEEVTHIVAYLHTLKEAVVEPQRPGSRAARSYGRLHAAASTLAITHDHQAATYQEDSP